MRTRNPLFALTLVALLAPGCHVPLVDVPEQAVSSRASGGGGSYAPRSFPMGTLRILTVTTGEDLDPDGYRLVIDGGRFEDLPVNGAVAVVMPPMTLSLHLAGVSPNCLPASPFPGSATIVADAVTEVLFALVCAPPPAGAVALRAPAFNEVIPQHPQSGACGGGSWFVLPFLWAEASHPDGVKGYHLEVERNGAESPLVDTVVVGVSVDVFRCGAVPDAQLQGWRWRVRAVLTDDDFGPWSEVRAFRFAPCRTSAGLPCT